MIPDKAVNVHCGDQSISAEWKDTDLPDENIYWVTVILSKSMRLETRMRQEEIVKAVEVVLSQNMTDEYIVFLGKVLSDSYRTTVISNKNQLNVSDMKN